MLGKFENFASCVIGHKGNGFSSSEANRICKKLEKESKDKPQLSYIFSQCQLLAEEGTFDPNAEFEILTSDKQYDSRYGSFSYSEKDLEEIAQNFNDDVRGVEIAVDINHDREKKAYAWIKPDSMTVKPSSQLEGHFSLFCNLYRYTPEGKELMSTGAYRYFSVELMLKWTKFSDGKKTTFKNVLFGLALTNSPVIKDMKPAFSEGNNYLHLNSNDMDLMKKLLSLLKGKEIVSKDEKDTMKSLYTELSEDDQKELKDEVDEVEKKPEESAESDEEKEKREQSEKASNKKLTEAQEALDKSEKRLSEVEGKLRRADLDVKADSFILSENVDTGFVKKDKNAVVDFMLSLSEAQLTEFEALLPKIKSVKFGETGTEDEEVQKNDDSDDKKAKELSVKILSQNPKLEAWQAMDQAYDELGMK